MKIVATLIFLCQIVLSNGFQLNLVKKSIQNSDHNKGILFKRLKNPFNNINSKRNEKSLRIFSTVDDTVETAQLISESTETFSWTKQWYPMAVVEYTDKGRPHEVELLGNKLVLWHDGKKWNAFADSCPHRGVPLSQGRVEKNGELLCAYHAWTFDGTGKCTNIPQVDDKLKSSLQENMKSCAIVHPTQELQGLIWIWGEGGKIGSNVSLEASLKKPQTIEELEDPEFKNRVAPYKYGFRHIPYGWDMFMENVQDPAHVPVSHHNIVGSRYNLEPFTLKRIKSLTEIPISDDGLLNPLYPNDVGFAYEVIEKNPKEIKSTIDFRPPVLTKIAAEYPNGAKTLLVLYASPTKPGYCMHVGSNILVKGRDGTVPKGLALFGLPLPVWLLHALASTFLHQDMVFLHQQERMLYYDSNYAFGNFQNKINVSSNPLLYFKNYALNEGDRSISELRKWIYRKANGGPKWGLAALQNGLPKRLPDNELFDVFETHTKECVVCSKALENFTKIKFASLFGSILSIIFLKGWKAVLSSILFTSFSLIFHKFSSLYLRYSFAHQNNN